MIKCTACNAIGDDSNIFTLVSDDGEKLKVCEECFEDNMDKRDESWMEENYK